MKKRISAKKCSEQSDRIAIDSKRGSEVKTILVDFNLPGDRISPEELEVVQKFLNEMIRKTLNDIERKVKP